MGSPRRVGPPFFSPSWGACAENSARVPLSWNRTCPSCRSGVVDAPREDGGTDRRLGVSVRPASWVRTPLQPRTRRRLAPQAGQAALRHRPPPIVIWFSSTSRELLRPATLAAPTAATCAARRVPGRPSAALGGEGRRRLSPSVPGADGPLAAGTRCVAPGGQRSGPGYNPSSRRALPLNIAFLAASSTGSWRTERIAPSMSPMTCGQSLPKSTCSAPTVAMAHSSAGT